MKGTGYTVGAAVSLLPRFLETLGGDEFCDESSALVSPGESPR
jgi:hypothetical protein